MSEDSNFCLYFRNEKIQFAWIQENTKKKLHLLNEVGAKLQISTKQCKFFWKDKISEDSKSAIERIKKTKTECQKIAENFEIAEVRELCEPGESYSLQYLCSFLFNPPWTFREEIALLMALEKNDIYFREKNNCYFAREENEIHRIRKERLQRTEQEEKNRREANWAEAVLNQQKPEVSEEEQGKFEYFIRRTYHFAIHLEHHPESDYLAKIWKLRINDSYIARNMLAKALKFLNQKISWGCLLTQSLQHHKPICEETVAEIETLKKSPKNFSASKRIDETHLNAFTIDSEETLDYDDAISLEKTSVGYRIRLHIADVACRVPVDSKLFHLARTRVTSFYTPKKVFHMFPPDISLDLFSLSQNNLRPVLTFLWEFDENSVLSAPKVYASMIRCRENLTYESVDQKIEEGDKELLFLLTFCEKMRWERIKNGALITNSKDLKIKIDDPENIKIIASERETPTNLIVSELAIQANYIAGSICRDHNLGGIYRIQDPFQLTKEFSLGEPVDMNFVIIKSARMVTEPEPHCGLGLDVYMQVTSPIRRFADLVGQHILSAWLCGETEIIRSGVLSVWGKACEDISKQCTGIERELEYHWKLKYLAQNQNQEHEASFVRYIRHGFALIKLDEIQIFKEIEYNGFYEGCRFKVRIDEIDLDLHYFKLKLVEEEFLNT